MLCSVVSVQVCFPHPSHTVSGLGQALMFPPKPQMCSIKRADPPENSRPQSSLTHLTLGWLGFVFSRTIVNCRHSIVLRLGPVPLGGMSMPPAAATELANRADRGATSAYRSAMSRQRPSLGRIECKKRPRIKQNGSPRSEPGPGNRPQLAGIRYRIPRRIPRRIIIILEYAV